MSLLRVLPGLPRGTRLPICPSLHVSYRQCPWTARHYSAPANGPTKRPTEKEQPNELPLRYELADLDTFSDPHPPLVKQDESRLNLDSIFVLSVPITTHRSYIYCHHRPSLLDSSQRKAVPFVMKAENKVVGLATKAWNKLASSKVSVNQKIVHFVRKMLNSIPYDENCLRSFPSKHSMIREINEEHLSTLPKAVMTLEVEAENVTVDQLKPIPVFHPRFQEPQAILSQMHQFKNSLGAHHLKWAIVCAIGIPISLPLALLPVVPNVPGFYLAYRLYCHLKAYYGSLNLGYLLECKDEDPNVEDTTHLAFEAYPNLDVAFLTDATFAKVNAEESDDNERILITYQTIDNLVEATKLTNIKDDLRRAMVQETKRIEKELGQDPSE